MTSLAGPPAPAKPNHLEPVDALTSWIDRVAEAAPELTDSQSALIKQLFGGRIDTHRSAAA